MTRFRTVLSRVGGGWYAAVRFDFGARKEVSVRVAESCLRLGQVPNAALGYRTTWRTRQDQRKSGAS